MTVTNGSASNGHDTATYNNGTTPNDNGTASHDNGTATYDNGISQMNQIPSWSLEGKVALVTGSGALPTL